MIAAISSPLFEASTGLFTFSRMTKIFELRVITEVGGSNDEACEEAAGELLGRIEDLILGSVEIVNASEYENSSS